MVPDAVQALLEHAPQLIDLFVPGVALLARARAFAQSSAFGPSGSPWLARLEQVLEDKPGMGNLQQKDLFDRYARVVQALAQQHPIILVLDDLQWADAGSISLLFHLGRKLSGQRILVIGAYRSGEVALGRDGERHPLEPVVSEFQRTWGEITMDMAEAEGRQLVEELLNQEPNHLGAAFRETLYRHTGGHALFTVELLRGLKERGDLRRDAEGCWVEGPSLDWERLPARVEAVVAESIERLPEEDQALLAVASVEGEEFTAEVLARVQGGDPRGPIARLSGPLSKQHRLVGAQSVQRVGEQRLSRYRFRHYLFQSYLYQRLDKVERSHLHEEVGLALEELYGVVPRPTDMERSALAEVIPQDDLGPATGPAEQNVTASPSQAALVPQLARHFEIAGLTHKALAYTWEAAERAFQRLAQEESDAHCRKALQLLRALPKNPQSLRYERKLQGALGYILGGMGSWLLPDALEAMIKAYELSEQLGPAERCASLYDLMAVYQGRGELRLACECAELAVPLAQGLHPKLLMAVRTRWARVQIQSGDFVAACHNLEPLIAPCLGSDPPPLHLIYEDNLIDLARAPWALWILGYPDRALRVAHVARQLGYAIEAITAIIPDVCDATCFMHQLRRDVRAVEAGVAELCTAVSEGQDVPFMSHLIPLYRGWVQVHTGELEEGIATLRQGMATLDAYARVLRAHWRGYLAEALARAGQTEEGLGLLEEALAEVERTGDRFSLAETYRLKGELLLQKGAPELEPEACFQKAITVARGQEARSWELRATLSLARLWQRQGKRDDARQVLSAIYSWFTEGFDTPDLQEARALLEERPPRSS